jgi:hypothetical protein
LFFFFIGWGCCIPMIDTYILRATVSSTIKKGMSAISLAIALTGLLLSAPPGKSLEFPPTGDRGAPSRTGSGGTRGDRCQLSAGQHLSALMPLNNVSTFTGEQASFWLHVPVELSEKPAEIFVSHPQTHEVVYQQQLLLPKMDSAGIVKIDLPATNGEGTPLLAPSQDYFWEFAAICDVADRSRDHAVQGFVHRLETGALPNDLSDDLSVLSLAQQAEQYAAAEIWQQTLEMALILRATDPTPWSELLASVELERLANEPVMAGTMTSRAEML